MNEIGEILKEARIEKGYTLDDLQQMTKIQKRYLQAIEDGNTEILPGRFYARAFVKQYADIVGLDGEQLLEEHLSETSQEASEEFAESVNVPTRTKGKKNDFLSDISENLPTILIFLLVATIILVIYFAWRQYSPAEENQQTMINEENTEQVVNQEAETAEEPAEDESAEEDAPADGEAENTEEENEEEPADDEQEEETEEQSVSVLESTGTRTVYEVQGPHPEEQSVTLTANGGETWVSITVAGGESNSGMLTDGDSMDVSFGPDASQVDIVVGNAPVTEVRLNDTELDYAPEAASVVRQDLQLQFVE